MDDRLSRMQDLVRRAHAGQTRNGGRLPYWIHPEGVAALCRQAADRYAELDDAGREDLVLAALGHDLYEDTPVTPDLVRTQFGDRVHRWIDGATNHRGDHDRTDYLTQVASADDEIRVIKAADLADNTLSVAYGLHDVGLPWTRTFFLPIAEETTRALHATPFTRLPRTGHHLLTLVDIALTRLHAAIDSADGQDRARPEHPQQDTSSVPDPA